MQALKGFGLRKVLLAPVVDGLEYHPLHVTEAAEHAASLLLGTAQYTPVVAVSRTNTHRLFSFNLVVTWADFFSGMVWFVFASIFGV